METGLFSSRAGDNDPLAVVVSGLVYFFRIVNAPEIRWGVTENFGGSCGGEMRFPGSIIRLNALKNRLVKDQAVFLLSMDTLSGNPYGVGAERAEALKHNKEKPPVKASSRGPSLSLGYPFGQPPMRKGAA